MKGVIIITWLDGKKERLNYDDYLIALYHQAKLLNKYKCIMKSCILRAVMN